MRQVILALDDALRQRRAVCYTALVETRGSTPQKAGAAMLVFPDGSQVGTLGGGCVEAEVKRRAIQVLEGGQRELLTFQLDSDYGWDDGLICGGRMTMLVDPLPIGADASYFQTFAELLRTGRGVTEAVILDPNKAGGETAESYLFDGQNQLITQRGSTSPSPTLTAALKPLSERPRPYVTGGVSYLPCLPRCRLVIVGAGHVGQEVAQLASAVDFDVWVIDDRAEYCNLERFPAAQRRIVAPLETGLRGLEIDGDTYCIIVTRGHHHDEQALGLLAERPMRYLGLIGSRRKIKLIYADLLQAGISREALRRVYAPLGFDIGSLTVPEIAVSIVAELVAHRNLGKLPERVRGEHLLDDLPGTAGG